MGGNLTRRSFLAAATLSPALALGTHGVLWAESPEFNPRVVIRRSFPPIKSPPVVTAGEADKKLRPTELVLGVVVNGAARAYPINMLTGPRREIINDTLGGSHIAATW